MPLVGGLAQQLQKVFPGVPSLAIEQAISDGLARASEDEGIDLSELVCSRDYSRLCPEGRKCQDLARARNFSSPLLRVG